MKSTADISRIFFFRTASVTQKMIAAGQAVSWRLGKQILDEADAVQELTRLE